MYCASVKLIVKNTDVLNQVIQFDLVFELTVQLILFF